LNKKIRKQRQNALIISARTVYNDYNIIQTMIVVVVYKAKQSLS